MRHAGFLVVLGFGVVLGLAHCSSSPVVCQGAACELDASAIDGPKDDVSVPPGCDAEADPKDAPACVVNTFGVFVDAASGSDSNPGTKESPLKTVAAALAKLEGKPRIYVCEGTYREHVKLTSAVSIYGAFACGTWSYSGAKSNITPPDRGIALSIVNAARDVVLSDLEVTAANGTDPGESSLAMLVAKSSKVTLRRLHVSAGTGVSGKNGTSATEFASPAPNGKSGNAATTPGEATSNPACQTSIGGAGGASAGNDDNGRDGKVSITPVFPTNASGVGGRAVNADCTGGSGGKNGSFGPGGVAGAGASTLGVLTDNGWTPADGADGGKGTDGQGGGGGARLSGMVAGGGGGAGGCGGLGGGKGQAGGASIAVAVLESRIELEASTLVAADAGNGGDGGKGQKGQLSGKGGEVPDTTAACPGGDGGIGGSGGGGGGGVGGVSVGVLYQGTPPRIDGTELTEADTHPTVTLGKKGAFGNKGPPGDPAKTSAPASKGGQEGTAGTEGKAMAVLKSQ